MDDLLSGYTGLDLFFFVCGSVGALIFFVRLAIQFIGIDHDIDSDMHAGGADAGHADSDVGFKLLTLHGLTSFFMMFGLVGLALHKQSGAGAFLSTAGALMAGLGTVWVIEKLFATARGLQSSGTLDNSSAIGGEGNVYLTIPAGGTGRVQVNIKDRLREFDAVSQNSEEIKTGVRIKVVWAKGGVLVVERV